MIYEVFSCISLDSGLISLICLAGIFSKGLIVNKVLDKEGAYIMQSNAHIDAKTILIPELWLFTTSGVAGRKVNHRSTTTMTRAITRMTQGAELS